MQPLYGGKGVLALDGEGLADGVILRPVAAEKVHGPLTAHQLQPDAAAEFLDREEFYQAYLTASGHMGAAAGAGVGTGLYIDGLLRGAEFQPSGADNGLREQLEVEWDTHGPEHMMARLAAVDPESAARLHLSDKRRILRALEVYLATGETITVHNARTKAIPPRYDAVMIGLNTEPRQILYDRIDRRVGVMLEQGLLKEVRDLLEDGLLEGTAAQAIGYKELLAHFRGEMTLDAAADLIRQKSRNYAKRQLTWFRRDERVRWIVYNSPDASAAVLQEATEYLRDRLYNGDVNF